MKALRARAKKTGKQPPALQNQPRLQFQDMPLLEAFRTVERSRPMGYHGPSSTPISEIMALCQMQGIVSLDERSKYLRVIQMLDGVYLAHWSQQQKNNKGR